MNNLIWRRSDGGISVTHLAVGVDATSEATRLRSNGTVPADWELVCTGGQLPADRAWRDAWAWTTPEPVVDICPAGAAEITRARLRAERAPLMAALDVEYMRADEAGDGAAKAAIARRKQALRDLPGRVDAVVRGDLDALAALRAADVI